jgi:hypothetical protein
LERGSETMKVVHIASSWAARGELRKRHAARGLDGPDTMELEHDHCPFTAYILVGWVKQSEPSQLYHLMSHRIPHRPARSLEDPVHSLTCWRPENAADTPQKRR